MDKIVLGCQRRDARAQRRLYDALAPRMLGLCMRYVRCREEAQDILHEGFIAVFDHIDELENGQSLQAWMGRIMVNRAINYVSRNNELVYCDMEQLPPIADEEEPELNTDRFCINDVMRALQQLPDAYRVVFNMHEVESIPYAEMTTILGQTESSLRGAVSRACQMLREILIKSLPKE